MFAFLKRKISGSENIQTLIINLKILLKKKTIEEILNSYPSQKLQTQETFHLKLIKHKLGQHMCKYRELTLNNKKLQFMISDLSKSFGKFNLIETNDFLEFYRRTLILGASDILTPGQYLNLVEALSNISFSHNTFAPIYAQTYLNFATLNIENPQIKNMKFRIINSLRCSDVHQILHSMSLCPYYFEEEIITDLSKNFHLIMGKHSSIENTTKVLNQYIIVCEQYKLKPSEKVFDEFRGFIKNLFDINESNLFRVFKFYNKNRTDTFLDPYKDRLKIFLKKSINNDDLLFEAVRCITTIFPEDNEMIELVKQRLKNDYLETLSNGKEYYKFRLLHYFLYAKVFDYDLCRAVTTNFEYDKRISKMYLELLICSKFLNLHLSPNKIHFHDNQDINQVLQDTDIESILHLLNKSTTHDGTAAISEADRLTYIASIKSRMLISPNIARVAQGLIRYSNTLYNSNLTI